MKPVLINGKLSVELNKPEVGTLTKAREIGLMLTELHQPTGSAIVDAINRTLLGPDAAEVE
jgi:hypothetical protein